MRLLLRMGLQAKLLLLALFAVLFFVGLFGYLAQEASNRATSHALEERLNTAKTGARALDEVFDEAIRRLKHIAAEHLYPKGWDAEALKAEVRRAYAEEGKYFSAGIYLFDRESRLVAAWPETGDPPVVADHVKAVVQGKSSPDIATALYGTPPQAIACLAVPVHDDRGNIVGVLAGSIYLDQSLIGQVIAPAAVDTTGYAELVDGSGVVLFSQRTERSGMSSDHASFLARRIQARRAEVSPCHSCHEVGAQTVPQGEILAFAPLSRVPWGVALRQSEAEALRIPRQTRQITYLLGGITLAVALMAVGLTTRLVVLPVQRLTRSLQKIAKGNLEEAITPTLLEDEIGILTRAAEEMRVALKQRTEELARRVRELNAVNQMSATLCNERLSLIQQLEQRSGQFSRLHKVAMHLAVSASLGELLNTVVAELSQVVASDYTSIVLVERDGALGLVAEDTKGMPPLNLRARPGGMTRTVVATGEPIYVPDLSADARSNPILVSAGIKSLAGIPLKVAGKVRGVLFVYSLRQDAFAQDMEVLTVFADWAAHATRQLYPT